MSKRQPTRWSNVFRYPDGTYYAFIKPMHGGAAKEVSLRTQKATMVPDALKLAELKVQRSIYAGSRLRVDETIEDYLLDRKKDWKPRTYRTNKGIVEKHIKPFFGEYKIVEVDHNLWAEFKVKSTLKDLMNVRNIVRNFLLDCMYKNWLPAMPLEFKLKKHKRRPRRILRPEEVTAIIKTCAGSIELFVHLVLFHGLRGNEATVRKYSDYNSKKRCLIVPDSKTNTPRAIPVLSFTAAIIEARALKSKSPYIFPKRGAARDHASSGWFRKGWVKLLKKAGLVDAAGTPLDITPHDLRATGEKYAAKLPNFTRTEREKMFGAKVEIQDSIYITEFFVDELRGLEAAMLHTEKGVEGLQKILESRALALGGLWDEKPSDTQLQ